jgi:DNA-binding NtrC family response regulator
MTHDQRLSIASRLLKAETKCRIGKPEDATVLLDQVAQELGKLPPDLYATYERVLAVTLAGTGSDGAALRHLSTASDIFETIGHALGAKDVARSTHVVSRNGDLALDQSADEDTTLLIIHSVATLIFAAQRPRLFAREVIRLLERANCCVSAEVVARDSSGSSTRIFAFGETPTGDSMERLRKFSIGADELEELELAVLPKADLASLSYINSMALTINSLGQIRLSAEEHENRLPLWPVDEEPSDSGDAVITGHMRDVMTQAQRVAKTHINVLITGESGTGKEILARAIHDASPRAQKPFVAFNCAAIPHDLLESQLFGHRRGAFTGAERDHLGLIRSAADGTIFLDEIGELGLDLQPKLLRFLESGEIAPLGEPALTINVRVLAATNTNLHEAVKAGRFREDLFYRLNVVPLTIRPLRERRDEIPGMITHFVDAAAREFGKGRLTVSEETMERLLLYRWPGNVRQLLNEVRRIVALTEPNSTIRPHLISPSIIDALPDLRRLPSADPELAVPLASKLLPTLSRVEFEMVRAALHKSRGRLEPAAKALGISRKGLYLKRQRLGL